MLYLLRSYIKDGSLLKVGYAKIFENRYFQYESHNPGIEKVSKKEGDIVDETITHLYLHFLGYGAYKDEWYKDCQEVIDAFNTSSSEIEKIVWDNRDVVFSSSLIDKNITYVKIYDILREKFGIDKETDVDVYRRMRDEKKEQKEKLERLISTDDTKLSDLEKFLKSFLVLKSFPDRMRLLCEAEFSDIELSWVLDQIPIQYKNYYSALGPERCRANGYNITEIKREYESGRVDASSIKDRILAAFSVGGRYTKFDIKEALRSIYSDLGYFKTPKAVDLEEYFKIKDCLITNKETGKRDKAFEIIGRKD